MEKFLCKIDSKVIDDLNNQISNNRVLDWGKGYNDNAGISYKNLSYILNYWKDKFSWENQEKKLNKHDQFKIKIDDIDIHFLHIKSSQKNAVPLMLIHGWPGSIFEFLDLIPFLTNPEENKLLGYQAFDLIIPSLPNVGYSFSFDQRPSRFK